MGNSSSSRKITPRDRAILDLKTQRDKLHQYQRRITHLTDLEKHIAKELLQKGDRSRALLALRRKKYQETLLEKTDAQLAQLERLTDEVDFALVQKDVLYGLQLGTNVLKEIHKEMGGIENVEKLMGENEEARAYQEEVSEMLGGKISNQDSEEVEEELEELSKEVNRMGVVVVDTQEGIDVGSLPDAPRVEIARREDGRKEDEVQSDREEDQDERIVSRRKKAEPLLAS
ncbi:MAG: hypothetical protein M1823_003572 [Watsoniomyces obsoletus]|nr:MAG: hypothetical protein M1823_003572 [Watsoniomyces obsoletus]